MKFSPLARLLPRVAICAATFAAAAGPLGAVELYWNHGGSGGTGIWGTGPGDKHWNATPGGGGPNIAWPEDGLAHLAVFQDTVGGTVTIFGTVEANGVVQDGAPYVVEGGTLVLRSEGSDSPRIGVRRGTLTIEAELAGSEGWIKEGAGDLVLRGLSSVTGEARVDGGTLMLAAPGLLSNDGTLRLEQGTVLTLGGGIDQTTGALVANGSTIKGSGTLTASTYRIGDGSTVEANLGIGKLTTDGQVILTGASAATEVTVNSGTLRLAGGNLAHSASLDLTDGGVLQLDGGQTVASFSSSGGTVAGTGTLSAPSYQLNAGSTVTGHLGAGTVRTRGTVAISGTTGSGPFEIGAGTLNFSGTSAAEEVRILEDGTLNHAGAFSAMPAVTNDGLLILNQPLNATSYVSNGGAVEGSATLVAPIYLLNSGSVVSSDLGAGILTSNGTVTLNGSSAADQVWVSSGILLNSGNLGTPDTQIDIAAGAALGGGTRNFTLLTTSGTEAGAWLGDLTNSGTVAPGGVGAIGALTVAGDFTNEETATLHLDIGASARDLLTIAGRATFGGTLALSSAGEPIAPNTPVQLIAANSYAGSFTSITDDLTGAVFFNAGTGELTRLVFDGADGLFSGATANQVGVWVSLYDDVIDPGVTNVIAVPRRAGPFEISGGMTDFENPDLLAALAASYGPAGLDGSVLNRLSPEVYAAFPDYAVQSTRARQRAALAAPALAVAPPVVSTTGAKDAAVPTANVRSTRWEVFAAADYFDGGTSGSRNQADYDLSGAALVAGARLLAGERFMLSAYLAAEDGELQGSLIDADVDGWSLGLLGEMRLNPAGSSRLTAGLSHGRFSFSGSRESVVATAGGAAPGSAPFRDVDGDALDLFVGIDATLYQHERFRLIPSTTLRYTSGTTESFTERTGLVPGSPIALAVGGQDFRSLLWEAALAVEAELTPRLSARGQIGLAVDLRNEEREVTGRFASGARPMTVESAALAEEMLFIHLGTAWRASEAISVGVGYRAEIRSNADVLNQVTLSAAFRF